MNVFSRFRRLLQVSILTVIVGLSLAPALAAALPSPASQLPVRAVPMQLVAACTKPHPLGLVTWYGYLKEYKSPVTGECAVCFNVTNTQNFDTQNCGGVKTSSISLVLLAVVDDMLRIAGLVAVGYIIYGAIQYVTSQGNPDATSRAQGTVINALIGLAIASVSVAFVSFLGSRLGG